MLSFLWVLLGIFYGKIPLGEIPMLTLAYRYSPWFQYFYSLILFLAILTTALANGFGLIKTLAHKINRRLAALYVVCAGLFLSGMGFSFIVDKVYRICGYIGLLLPIYMLIDELKKAKNIKNKEKKQILKKSKVK